MAASALYNELVAAEVCEALGLATEPRTVTPGRRPVMEIAGVPHELIRSTSRRGDQIAACLAELEHEYATALDDDGEPLFLPMVSERARAKLNQIAALGERSTDPHFGASGWVAAALLRRVSASAARPTAFGDQPHVITGGELVALMVDTAIGPYPQVRA
ncbi:MULTISPECIES: relaxase domain-containing protein [Streptomyces]|uniref:TrwC relaxase domain-containing protein n=1 Tax=Streptomyces canarius TaxID=285453 RepID=A0ABQ3DEI2_9ACTN|nr:relaxase domain-containing protein [Streptomyces canarius]GHA67355.1 hypothetical protein GCM10010345_83780 [Streptomyces canarius]